MTQMHKHQVSLQTNPAKMRWC